MFILVEDDSEVRLSLSDLLRYLGYGVSDFAGAESFLQQAQRCSPAVLVLDADRRVEELHQTLSPTEQDVFTLVLLRTR